MFKKLKQGTVPIIKKRTSGSPKGINKNLIGIFQLGSQPSRPPPIEKKKKFILKLILDDSECI
jgi:hypothetical protein